MEIKLRRGALTAAVETLGGELVSLAADGTEYIWGGDPAYWTGRNPVLFPIVGGLKNGTVLVDGKPFQMGRHGFARRSEFTVADQGEDFAVLQLRESPETLAQFPRPFSLKVRHQLEDDGFTTSFTVENPGDRPLPFCVGAHTAFRCPLVPGETFEDYELRFDQPETADSLLLNSDGILQAGKRVPFLQNQDTLPLTYEPFARQDTIIFDGLDSQGVSLVSRRSGKGVHMAYDGFPMVAFWTKPGAPYICLEPWHGCAAFDNESGEFTEKPHCIVLIPGDAKTLRYRVRLL